MHVRKCLTALSMAFLIGATSILPSFIMPTKVMANIVTDNEKANIRNRCSTLEELLQPKSPGIYGLLEKLNYINEYAMYVKFIATSNIGFSTKEISYYEKSFRENIKAINDLYHEDGPNGSYNRIELAYGDEYKDILKQIERICITDIPDYLEECLLEINQEIGVDSEDPQYEDKKDEVLKKNRSQIKMITMIFQNYDIVEKALTNQSTDENGDVKNFSVDSSENNKTVKDKIQSIQTKYQDIIDYGIDVVAADGSSINGISVDLESSTAIENLANVSYDNDGKLIYPDETELSGAYLALVSASAVYTPFQSYAGSEEFLTAASSLCKDTETAKDLVELYNNTKNYRKPLYIRDLDDEGNPTGTAKIATISDFLNTIAEGKDSSFCTVTGALKLDKNDSNTWRYFVKSGVTTLQDEEASDDRLGDDDAIKDKASVDVVTVDETDNGESQNGADDDDESSSESSEGSDSNSNSDSGTQNDNYLGEDDTARNEINVIKGNNIERIDNIAYGTESTHANDLDDENLVSATLALKAVKKATKAASKSNKSSCYTQLYNYVLSSGGIELYWPKNKQVSKDDTDDGIPYGSVDVLGTKDYNKKGNTYSYKGWSGVIWDYLHNGGASSKPSWSKNVYDKQPSKKGYYEDLFIICNGKFNKDTVIKAINSFCAGSTKPIQNDVTGSGTKDANGNTAEEDDKNSSSSPSKSDSNEDDSELEVEGNNNDENMNNLDPNNKDSYANTDMYAYSEITELTRLSEPVLMVGLNHQRAVDNMTTMLLSNIINHVSNISSIKDQDTRFVYMNCYGDIVLDDNMIIFPAATNPLLYNTKSDYNPFTVAMMNSYPVMQTQSMFGLVSESDVGNFVFYADYGSKKNLADDKLQGSYGFKAQSVDSVGKDKYLTLKIRTDFSLPENSDEEIDLMEANPVAYKNEETMTAKYCYPLTQNTDVVVNDNTVFPYVYTEDDNFMLAKAIAYNAYFQLMVDDSSMEEDNQNQLCDNYIVHNVIVPGLDGTDTPEAYSKNSVLQYDQFVQNSYDRFENIIYEIVNNLVTNLSSTDGILGISNSYNVPLIGNLLNFLRNNMFVIMIVICFFVLFAYAKNSRNLVRSIIIAGFSTGIVYVFICALPSFLPYLFNSVSDNITDNLASEIVATRAEQDSAKKILSNSATLGKTASITLYRGSVKDIIAMCDELSCDTNDIVGGKYEVLSEPAGTYFENDSIKMNINVLMNTLPIASKAEESDAGTFYQFTSYKTTSNNLDYYTPYYKIVDNFITKVNTLIRIYKMPRRTATFAKGVSKDAYAVYNYVNSPVFLTPGDYSADDMYKYQSALGADENVIKAFQKSNDEIQYAMEKAYGDTDDWLGITNVVSKLSKDERRTLWAQQMQANNYYDANWNPNKEKLNNLIYYINFQTKKFVIDCGSMIEELSDEELFKIISLRALLAFNQKVTDVNNNLYPLFINYNEIPLKDILLSVFTNDYTKFISMDMDISNYILQNYGWLNLTIFGITVIFMFLFANITKILFPVLYILLGFLLLGKLVSYNNIHPLIKGYFKITGLVFADFVLFVAGVLFTNKTNGSVFCIWLMFVISLFCLWLLMLVITSMIADFADMGNSAVNVKLKNTLNKITRGKFDPDLNVRSTNIIRQPDEVNIVDVDDDSQLSRFDMNRDIDDLYSSGEDTNTIIISNNDFDNEDD